MSASRSDVDRPVDRPEEAARADRADRAEPGYRNTALGGPLGRFARLPAHTIAAGRWAGTVVPAWQPVASVLSLVAAVMVALGVVQKSYCFNHGWGGDAVFWRACYSDLPNLYTSSTLSTSSFPYTHDALTQPVGTGAVLWLLSFFSPEGPSGAPAYVGVWAVVAALLAITLVVVTALTVRRDPWVAGVIAFSPLLVTVALVGADLLGVTLVSLGLLLWSREKEWAAGAVFGLAVLSRTYALIVLLALVLVALRAGQYRALLRTGATAALGALFVLLVLRTAGFDVGAPYSAWLGGLAEFGSAQYLLTLTDTSLTVMPSTVVALAGWVFAILAGALMTLGLPRRPRIAETAVVMLVIVMLTAKAVPPQWALWLLSLVALAGLPRRVYVPWMVIEVVYFVAVWMHIPASSSPTRALPDAWYAFFLLLRLAALAYLAWSCYRQAATRPPAARTGEDALLTAEPDDAAGAATGARDRLLVTFRASSSTSPHPRPRCQQGAKTIRRQRFDVGNLEPVRRRSQQRPRNTYANPPVTERP